MRLLVFLASAGTVLAVAALPAAVDALLAIVWLLVGLAGGAALLPRRSGRA